MRIEQSEICTIPMPVRLKMSSSKKSILIELEDIIFEYGKSEEPFSYQTEIGLYEAIFERGEVIKVTYEDPYDRIIGKKKYELKYDKNLNWVQLIKSKVS